MHKQLLARGIRVGKNGSQVKAGPTERWSKHEGGRLHLDGVALQPFSGPTFCRLAGMSKELPVSNPLTRGNAKQIISWLDVNLNS